MAFYSAFLKPIRGGSHKPTLGVPFDNVVEVPTPCDIDNARACTTISEVIPSLVMGASSGGIDGGVTLLVPCPLQSTAMRRRLFPLTLWICPKTTHWSRVVTGPIRSNFGCIL